MTSTTDTAVNANSSKESVSKDVESNAEAKPKAVITGRDILIQYFKGDSIALITYRKICNAIEMLPKWEPAAKIQFLEQFLNISDLLDDRCTDLVTNLSRLSWQAIPSEIMDRYLSMLCDVAIRQVTHTEIIYCSAVSNLIPVMKLNEGKGTTELALSIEEQDKYYAMAHRVIAQIYKCFPMSTKILLKALRVGVPHFSHDSWRFIGYMRNLNMLAKSEFHDDKNCTADTAIFDMDEEQQQEADSDEDGTMAKLDGVMRDVLCYIAMNMALLLLSRWVMQVGYVWAMKRKEKKCFPYFCHSWKVGCSWLYTSATPHLSGFTSAVLMSYATRTLELLWSVIVRPQIAQSDVAKGHGAAAYLAAFLARAKYLDLQFCPVSSGMEHFTHCVRHSSLFSHFGIKKWLKAEILKKLEGGDLDASFIRRWIHLNTLLDLLDCAFAAISRSLQLVYCNHLLPFDAGTKLPFEPMFPFDSFKLKSSITLVCSQMRRFSPLAEDKSEVSSVLRSSRISTSVNEDNMDFLEEDDMIIGSYSDTRPSGVPQCGYQPSMFTIYSTSPGLRHIGILWI
ncbi:RNA polymerase I specific transcription initiation factor RRN3 [Ostertagia ostertagi]